MEIVALKNQISPASAKAIIKEKELSVEIRGIEPIFYPYFNIEASVNTRILSHTINGSISCLIDMINGVEAFTEKITEKQKSRIDAAEHEVLNISLSIDEARKRAISYITHIILQRVKILQVPEIIVLKEELLYKPFWLIECCHDNENFHLLMDAVNGYYHLVLT